MKKIPIFLCFSFGNLKIGMSFILALHQWERFSMDESCLTRNTIGKSNRAGRADEPMKQLKRKYAFFIFDLKSCFRSQILYKAV